MTKEREDLMTTAVKQFSAYDYPVIAIVSLPDGSIKTRLYKREGYAFRWANRLMDCTPGCIGLIRTSSHHVWDFGDGEWVGMGY